ncbi:Vacuolar protein sorting-associated protein 53, partial [Linderina macrospora]
MTRTDTAAADSRRSGQGQGQGHLDSVDFTAAGYVDRLFGDEASLEGLDVAAANIRHRHATTAQDIRQLLRQQSAAGGTRQTQDLSAAKAGIAALYERISEMQAKARVSERMVQDITQDIKALDFAKRNLTAAMTTMKRVQMLTASVERLQSLSDQRRFGDAAQAVLAVSGLSESLQGFGRVRQVAGLIASATALQQRLTSAVCGEIEAGFDAQGVLVGDSQAMHEACVCADALGSEAQARISGFYCAMQLRAYGAIFQANDDVSQLSHVSRRYAWVRRILRNYGDAHATVFPAAWRVDEKLCRAFAEATRDQLAELMATQSQIDVEHLTGALGDTLAFEAQCDKKFGGGESFAGSIACAFEPYMSVYIGGEEAKYAALVRRFQAEPFAVDDDAALSVLASSTDMLYQYRESLRQCAALSTGAAMLDLARVFDRFLAIYARDVLVLRLPRLGGSGGSDASLEDIQHACLVINTADYCASVAGQLEHKIVERISPPFKDQVSFEPSREALLGAINTSVRVLVSGVEAMCEPAFAQLALVPWHSLRSVGDQSAYVMLVASALEAAADTARKAISGQRYFRSFCDKLAARITQRYLAAIHACGVVSEEGAEQLLLDAQALKSTLAALPGAGETAPAAYARIVASGMGAIEAQLKAILAPADPPEALVDRFLLLFENAPRDVFQQILALKGIRPPEQPVYFRTLSRRLMEATPKEKKATPRTPAAESPGRAAKTTTPKTPAAGSPRETVKKSAAPKATVP